MLLLGCGSGQQSVDSPNGGGAATGGSSLISVLMDLGRSAENAFYSFLELLSGTLGFTSKSTTKKEDVGGYFKSLGAKLGEASDELEQVAKKSETELDKGGLLNKSIKEAVDTAKATLRTLKTHLESLGTVGDSNKVGDAATNTQGITPTDAELKKALKALQEIVKSAKEKGMKEPEAGNVAVKIDNADNKDGAKILATDSAGKPAAGDVGKAVVILSSVSGEEILASIVKSGEDDAALGAAADANTSAISFAKGGNGAHLAQDAALASAVSGGIALRSLVKDGKLASGAADGSAGGKEEVQKVGVNAVNKLLVAVEDMIKKTVKNVLKIAKEKIDGARAPKSAE
ncbi:variable large family protein (plasmid) [Borrelia puertoricensis]|uniref:variable large family protein n=1 Tax=Borrelia puertoricensis TaxID=2756107 RepID=UPI003EB6B6DC